jgi:ferredoxin
MIRVHFIAEDGEKRTEASAAAGQSLLEVAQNCGMPLEGTCEGQMACSTCHVIVEADWFDKLKRPSDDEEDMLDLAAHVTRYSRLSCQILLDDSLDGLTVRIPPESHNMQGR